MAGDFLTSGIPRLERVRDTWLDSSNSNTRCHINALNRDFGNFRELSLSMGHALIGITLSRGVEMARITDRNLEEDIRDKLRKLARSQGQSTEEVVREILRRAVLTPIQPSARLGTRLASLFSKHGLKVDIAELRGNEIAPPSFHQ